MDLSFRQAMTIHLVNDNLRPFLVGKFRTPCKFVHSGFLEMPSLVDHIARATHNVVKIIVARISIAERKRPVRSALHLRQLLREEKRRLKRRKRVRLMGNNQAQCSRVRFFTGEIQLHVVHSRRERRHVDCRTTRTEHAGSHYRRILVARTHAIMHIGIVHAVIAEKHTHRHIGHRIGHTRLLRQKELIPAFADNYILVERLRFAPRVGGLQMEIEFVLLVAIVKPRLRHRNGPSPCRVGHDCARLRQETVGRFHPISVSLAQFVFDCRSGNRSLRISADCPSDLQRIHINQAGRFGIVLNKKRRRFVFAHMKPHRAQIIAGCRIENRNGILSCFQRFRNNETRIATPEPVGNQIHGANPIPIRIAQSGIERFSGFHFQQAIACNIGHHRKLHRFARAIDSPVGEHFRMPHPRSFPVRIEINTLGSRAVVAMRRINANRIASFIKRRVKHHVAKFVGRFRNLFFSIPSLDMHYCAFHRPGSGRIDDIGPEFAALVHFDSPNVKISHPNVRVVIVHVGHSHFSCFRISILRHDHIEPHGQRRKADFHSPFRIDYFLRIDFLQIVQNFGHCFSPIPFVAFGLSIDFKRHPADVSHCQHFHNNRISAQSHVLHFNAHSLLFEQSQHVAQLVYPLVIRKTVHRLPNHLNRKAGDVLGIRQIRHFRYIFLQIQPFRQNFHRIRALFIFTIELKQIVGYFLFLVIVVVFVCHTLEFSIDKRGRASAMLREQQPKNFVDRRRRFVADGSNKIVAAAERPHRRIVVGHRNQIVNHPIGYRIEQRRCKFRTIFGQNEYLFIILHIR